MGYQNSFAQFNTHFKNGRISAFFSLVVKFLFHTLPEDLLLAQEGREGREWGWGGGGDHIGDGAVAFLNPAAALSIVECYFTEKANACNTLHTYLTG